MIKNLFTQMIYRIVLCCVSALAVLLSLGVFYEGTGANGFSWEFIKYYTNISNYFVFAVSVIVLADNVRRVKNGETYGYNKKVRTLKFMTTIMIMVTFLVYSILLGDPFSADFWLNIGNISKHVFAPLLFILDFFLFDEHGTVKLTDPLKSVVIPLIYVVYIMILGVAVKDFEYPYFFLDVNELGYGGVAVWVVILLVVFIAIGYLMWLYDKLVKADGRWKLVFKTVPSAEAEQLTIDQAMSGGLSGGNDADKTASE